MMRCRCRIKPGILCVRPVGNQHRPNLWAKRPAEKLRPLPKVHEIELHPTGFVNRAPDRIRLVGREEDPFLPVPDDVQDAPQPPRDHRRTARQGFDRGDPEVLDPRLHGRWRPGRGRATVSAGTRPTADPGAGEPLEAAPLGPLADHDQGQPGRCAGPDRPIHFFVRRQGGDDQNVLPGPLRLWREVVGVDRRRQDPRLAPVVAADSVGDEGGVGQIAVDAVRGGDVPAAGWPAPAAGAKRRDRPRPK